MDDEELSPFEVKEYKAKYQVVDDSQQTWLETSNAITAEHYADLLNKAYKSGVKKGVRKGRLNQ